MPTKRDGLGTTLLLSAGCAAVDTAIVAGVAVAAGASVATVAAVCGLVGGVTFVVAAHALTLCQASAYDERMLEGPAGGGILALP